MGWFALVFVVGMVVFYLLVKKTKREGAASNMAHRAVTAQPSAGPADASRAVGSAAQTPSPTDELAILRAHWVRAEQERDSGGLKTFPKWFFDDPTERQLERLKTEGVKVSGKGMTKGVASDLIGLHLPPEEEDEAILKFFKVSSKGMNQTLARYEIAKLMADPANAAAWEARPADLMQKECLKFFGLPVARGLSSTDAAKLIDDHRAELEKTGGTRADEWDAFESLVDDLSDKETREDAGIKQPPLSVIRQAFDALLASGTPAGDIDADTAAEKILELKPELTR